ncbi:MAG: hypothetical protein E4G99_07405 [Anaerolineales bacterium]|nr:MAG: hypothetical protein E4G99_07405 [Anaerolineales bacterium]
MMKKAAFIILCLTLLATACGPSGPSPEDTWNELAVVDKGFGDSLELAFATGRGNLAPVILSLQEHLKDFRAIVPSEDVPTNIWSACEDRFELPIDAFIAFLDTDYSEQSVQNTFARGASAGKTCVGWFTENVELE